MPKRAKSQADASPTGGARKACKVERAGTPKGATLRRKSSQGGTSKTTGLQSLQEAPPSQESKKRKRVCRSKKGTGGENSTLETAACDHRPCTALGLSPQKLTNSSAARATLEPPSSPIADAKQYQARKGGNCGVRVAAQEIDNTLRLEASTQACGRGRDNSAETQLEGAAPGSTRRPTAGPSHEPFSPKLKPQGATSSQKKSARKSLFGPRAPIAPELSQLEQPTTKQADRDASGGHLGPAVPSATEGKPFSGLLWDKDDSWFDPSDTAKVDAALRALLGHSSLPQGVPLCRDAEAARLHEILQGHAAESRGGSVYVSGLPGTGKSLTVHNLVRSFWEGEPGCIAVSINCATLQPPRAVFRRALQAFREPEPRQHIDPITYPAADAPESHDEALAALKDLVKEGSGRGKQAARGTRLLILDEVDMLKSKDQVVLQELFSLPKLPGSSLIVIGIANSINLVEQHLPGLREAGIQPSSVPFSGYTAHQVASILQERLSGLPGRVFADSAIKFCALKMARVSSDMRSALQACASALRSKVAEYKAHPTSRENEEASAANGGRLVVTGDMAKAMAPQGGGGGLARVHETIKNLPPQQQGLLAAVAKLLARGGSEPDEGGVSTPASAKSRHSRGNRTGPASTPTPTSKANVKHGSVSLLTPTRPLGKAMQTNTPKSAVKRSAVLGAARECTILELQDGYCRLSKELNLTALRSHEVTSVLGNFADMGLLDISKAKEAKMQRIRLRISEGDIALALQDKKMLQAAMARQ